MTQQIMNINPNKLQPYNLTDKIIKLSERKLFKNKSHPLTILKTKISNNLGNQFKIYDNLLPIVTTQQNFDVLNIPINHVSRQLTDSFYINQKYLLRTHTSAHQLELLSTGINGFAVFGDVYRRDQIDKYHYPIFHQMQAVRILGKRQKVNVEEVANDLKNKLEDIVRILYGQCQMRWVDAYFPFTEPSFELQIFFENKWVEMLGCGVIHKDVMKRAGRQNQLGWAAGLGLQRFAMRLFKINDVRLFWSEDKRFIQQFQQDKITTFKQFSKYPGCYKDLSMWILPEYNSNNLFSLIRDIGGDLIESVEQIQTYTDAKNNKVSKTYRICFRSLERTLNNDQIVKLQFQIRDKINQELKEVKLR